MEPVSAVTALVVDDNFFNRDLCTLALKHVGYQVEEAENGVDALKILARESFDLLILDLAMPEMDGLEVMKRLRAQPAHKNMAVIVMTANPHMATDSVFDTVDFMMNKPIDIDVFARIAQRIASNKPRISS